MEDLETLISSHCGEWYLCQVRRFKKDDKTDLENRVINKILSSYKFYGNIKLFRRFLVPQNNGSGLDLFYLQLNHLEMDLQDGLVTDYKINGNNFTLRGKGKYAVILDGLELLKDLGGKVSFSLANSLEIVAKLFQTGIELSTIYKIIDMKDNDLQDVIVLSTHQKDEIVNKIVRGNLVFVIDGIYKGWSGIVEDIKGNNVTISVNILGILNSIVLDLKEVSLEKK